MKKQLVDPSANTSKNEESTLAMNSMHWHIQELGLPPESRLLEERRLIESSNARDISSPGLGYTTFGNSNSFFLEMPIC